MTRSRIFTNIKALFINLTHFDHKNWILKRFFGFLSLFCMLLKVKIYPPKHLIDLVVVSVQYGTTGEDDTLFENRVLLQSLTAHNPHSPWQQPSTRVCTSSHLVSACTPSCGTAARPDGSDEWTGGAWCGAGACHALRRCHELARGEKTEKKKI